MWISHQLDYDTGYYHIHFLFLASRTQAAGASMIRPLRQSVSLRNIAASQDAHGSIRVLHTNHPMNFAVGDVTNDQTARMRISSANHTAFREMIDQHPQTRTVTNTELRVGVSIPVVPGTMSTCQEYHEWVDLPDTKHTRLVDSTGDLVFWSEW